MPYFPQTYRRTVRSSDRERIREIVASTGFFSPEELNIAIELVDEHLQKGVASGYSFLFAEQSDTVVGYACYGPIPGTAASYDLYWIAVHADFQRQGWGKDILAQTEALIAAQKGQNIYIDTSSRSQYEPTRKFYRDYGYRQCAFFEDFYAPGDSKVVYVKNM
ncbi:MAG: GNAT family N-acetyltransferase [Deltaproteobacteria bacterium]|nr:GNAT family N-acetyltransferase [Deltaproteobacteria bacterium]